MQTIPVFSFQDTAKSELTPLLNVAPGLFKKLGDSSLLVSFALFSEEPVYDIGTEAPDAEDK